MNGSLLSSLQSVNPPSLATSDLGHAIRAMDRRFQLATGSTDLLAMSECLSAEEFRSYLAMSREWRARHRLTCPTPKPR